MKKYFATLAPRLFSMGYPVLPAVGKRVLLTGWSDMTIDEPTVSYWVSNGQAACNVGMRCGDPSLGMALTMGDVDIYDRDVARIVAASIEETFGATIERRGQAPKRGIHQMGQSTQLNGWVMGSSSSPSGCIPTLAKSTHGATTYRCWIVSLGKFRSSQKQTY